MRIQSDSSNTSSLTRRVALAQVAVGGVAAFALGASSVAAQDADEERSPLELARRAAELREALAPVIVLARTGTDEELAQAAQDYLAQLQEQGNVTAEEAADLQQIVDAATTEGEELTKIEKIQAIVDKVNDEGESASPAALAIAVIALAAARRDEQSSGETATPVPEEDDSDGSLLAGIVGALAGAAIGGLIAGDTGAVIGAVAGGLAGAT
jgi:hypothetical protein